MRTWTIIAFALFTLAGCDDDGEEEPCEITACNLECLERGYAGGICTEDDECQCSGDGPETCQPHTTRPCTCPGGEVGTQSCAPDGTHWYPCQCPG